MRRSLASSRITEAHRSRKTSAAIPAASSASVIRVDPTATTGASVRLASVAHAKTWPAPVARTTRSGVSHASGAGRKGPASERVRVLGDEVPRSRISCDGFPARGSRARTASAGAARARQRRVRLFD